MEIFNSIINEIKLGLSDDINLSDIDFISAYPNSASTKPIKKTCVVMGLSTIEILDKVIGRGYVGLKNNIEIYSKFASVGVNLKIYSPENLSGESCIQTFSKICNSLFCGDKDYHIKSASCKDIVYNKSTACFTLECTLKVDALIENYPDNNI